VTWRSAPSVRLRLTAWYVVVLLLMLVVYATATYIAVRHEFFEQLDEQLVVDLKNEKAVLTPKPDGRIARSEDDRHHNPANDEDRGSDVRAASGEPIARTGVAVALPVVAFAAKPPRLRYDSIVVEGRRWRILSDTVLAGDRAVVVRVFRSEERLHQQLWEVLSVLVLGLPLVVLLAGAGGYALARRALTPIDHLASEARRITAASLHERLSVPNPQDEIGRLATVINEMFGRLESSFDRLRRFTADASHELRTPLAVIRGIGEVGLEKTRTPAEYKEAMSSMLEEVDRLTSLVDTLLRLSHGDAGTVRLSRVPIDLGRLTREVVSSLGLLVDERTQQLHVEIAGEAPVLVDRLLLREAITNVVDNAIKYSPPASAIDVRVQANGNRAVLTVADQGPGIAPEHHQRIFDRFFRLDEGRSRDGGGTGLGLAIAKWAVELNGGRISVEAGTCGGSVFRIELPMGSTAIGEPFEAATQRTGAPEYQ
jgi:heavy metal sensor kinase